MEGLSAVEEAPSTAEELDGVPGDRRVTLIRPPDEYPRMSEPTVFERIIEGVGRARVRETDREQLEALGYMELRD